MSGHLCAVEKVNGVILMRVAKGAQRAWIGMRINFVLVCEEEKRFDCTYLCKSASVFPGQRFFGSVDCWGFFVENFVWKSVC
jgi:hypothetical protein